MIGSIAVTRFIILLFVSFLIPNTTGAYLWNEKRIQQGAISFLLTTLREIGPECSLQRACELAHQNYFSSVSVRTYRRWYNWHKHYGELLKCETREAYKKIHRRAKRKRWKKMLRWPIENLTTLHSNNSTGLSGGLV